MKKSKTKEIKDLKHQIQNLENANQYWKSEDAFKAKLLEEWNHKYDTFKNKEKLFESAKTDLIKKVSYAQWRVGVSDSIHLMRKNESIFTGSRKLTLTFILEELETLLNSKKE